MSSLNVRNDIKAFFAIEAPTENIIDITAIYGELSDALLDNTPSIGPEDNWVGIDFIPSDEEPVGLHANNTQGRYREYGIVMIHVVEKVISGVDFVDSILQRSEAIRDSFRGQRINNIIIQSVTPPNFKSGATLQMEDGYQSATFTLAYYADINL